MSDERPADPDQAGVVLRDGRILLLYVYNGAWHLVLSTDPGVSAWDRLASGELPGLVKPAEDTPPVDQTPPPQDPPHRRWSHLNLLQ